MPGKRGSGGEKRKLAESLGLLTKKRGEKGKGDGLK